MNKDDDKIFCDGERDAAAHNLGHPRIYLKVVDNRAVCPYCGKEFSLKKQKLRIESKESVKK